MVAEYGRSMMVCRSGRTAEGWLKTREDCIEMVADH
jgi:hypothetical protein